MRTLKGLPIWACDTIAGQELCSLTIAKFKRERDGEKLVGKG